MMSIAKYLFRKALENKMVVVTDYYDIMESKRKGEKEENYKQLVDQSTPPSGCAGNDSASLFGASKGIRKATQKVLKPDDQDLSCPICLAFYHAYLIFKCENCEQPFCERCKWNVHNCNMCGYNLTNSACRDYHRERVVRCVSNILNNNGSSFKTFVKPSAPNF